MADCIAERVAQLDGFPTDLPVDSPASVAAGPEIFAKVSSILVKQILDLREALEFYEMHLFHAPSDRGRLP
jgi:hypothetical protein